MAQDLDCARCRPADHYVHDLIIHPRDNIIVFATHGRGMWALDANPVNEKDKRRTFYYED